MKNSKIIFLAIVILLILLAGLTNFSKLKNSLIGIKKAISLLEEAKAFASVEPSSDAAFINLIALRNSMSLVSFGKEDLDLFQKFFPVLLEKSFGLSAISLNMTKQYSSLNKKKIFNCNIKFTGDYRKFLKAINGNFPSIFISKLEPNGNSFSADVYGYVTDLAGEFVYNNTAKAYSVFEQVGVIEAKEGKTLLGSLTFTKDGNIYFLKPVVEGKSYLICENAVKYSQMSMQGNNTYLVLPIKDDLSIQE